ncbi:MAG: glycosyltransferase family 4 protein [Rhodobacteraceae bacterium]|nr:glycosyltransferase family 4 protein [Paracoccaceae bacterium]MCB2122094.1 glycosyltransferase family 4 protein [Paracoccaceae bacterium]MCB2139338.1 glycosyltransferase family 4 protein [Paracoccaceae bacterium]MCB2142401.1 glycosyltransferase family 4 protein [Paracoccaceae bacterium]MCB2151182.1 glycosyltransferase family 4 protein [Paracoccaceae bacterium]
MNGPSIQSARDPRGPVPTAVPKGRIAYLTGEYPKVSHTFIQREVAALRAHGVDVMTCTVRRAPARDVVGADQQEEQARTFCILDAARNPLRLLGAHLALIRRSPARWFEALRLAWRTRPPGLKALLWQAFYFAEAGVLARHLQKAGATHLHNHFANSSCSVAMLTSVMSGVPFSFTEHGPAIFFEVGKWHLGEKVARASFVACISHFCRSQMMLFSDPAHWHKFSIVHCGVEPARYGAVPRGDFAQRALFIGRMDPVKGVPVLLRAFGDVARDYPGARLDLVGDGPAMRDFTAMAQTTGVADRVRFLGYRNQDEVAAHLAEADMLVLPSFAEGVPVVLMEAMASRIPVIASRVAGVAELVEDGQSGFVLPPGDERSLATSLRTLFDAPERCREMGLAGRAKVEVEFDIRTEAARLAGQFAAAEDRRA